MATTTRHHDSCPGSPAKAIASKLFIVTTMTLAIAWIFAAVYVAGAGWTRNVTPNDSKYIPVVQRYYEEINSALASGDTGKLESVLSDSMVDHDLTTEATIGSGAVTSQIQQIRRVDRDAQIVSTLTSQPGGSILAVSEIKWSGRTTILGLALVGNSGLWPTVEKFSVVGKWIVARQYKFQNAVRVQPMSNPVGIESRRFLHADVFEFPRGSETGRTAAGSGEMISVLNSALELSLAENTTQSALILHSPTLDNGQRETLLPGSEATLSPGDFAIIPINSTYSVRNDSPTRAYLLTVVGELSQFKTVEDEQSVSTPVFGITRTPVQTFPGKRPLNFASAELFAAVEIRLGIVELASDASVDIDPHALLVIVISSADGPEISATKDAETHSVFEHTVNGVNGDEWMRVTFIAVGENGNASLLNTGDEKASATILAVSKTNPL